MRKKLQKIIKRRINISTVSAISMIQNLKKVENIANLKKFVEYC